MESRLGEKNPAIFRVCNNMSSSSTDTLTQLKLLENQLESKLAIFGGMVAKASGDLEGGSTVTSGSTLSADIDNDLNDMNKSISMMRNDGDSTTRHDFVLRRYESIYSDYMAEYAKLSSRLQRAKETNELFQYKDRQGRTQAANSYGPDEGGNATDKLLRERSSIAGSLKGVNEVISQAYEAKDALFNQRGVLSGASQGLLGMIRSVPTFNKLINAMSKKKDKENLIVAALISVLAIFTIWWVLLR